MNATDRVAVVDGVRLAYRDRGEGDPVMFVHGTPSHSYIWRNVLPPVESAGHRAIAYDLLGYGASERPVARDTSATAQAALFEKFLDHLGLDAVDLVAHDLGGAIAQILAVRAPHRIRRLMMIDSVGYDSWPSPTWQEIIADHLDDHARLPRAEFEAMLARQLRMTVADPERMSGSVLDAYLAPYRSRLGRVSFFEHQVRHYDSVHTRRVADRLGELAMPVRVLWGAEDRWQPIAVGERLASDIPRARLVVIPGGGHFLMEEVPDRVAAEIIDFLTV